MSSLLPRLRIFISSPGDVDTERKITARVLERLAGEFRGRLTLEPYFWEDEPMRHQQTFQDQIPATGDFDLVICILWSRLGTPLTGPDGKAYLSGTDYEVESAREAFEKTGKPDLMIYLNQTPAQLRKLPREERERMLSQLEALEDFVERHCFDRRTGIIKGAFAAYRDLGQFEDALEKHVRKFVQARLPAEDPASEPPRAEISWHGRPFQGLRAFDFEHAPIFFGRTRATGEVLALLRRRAVRLDEARAAAIGGLTEGIDPAAATFVLVCAMSGVGKSSLVRAGVLPLLVQPGGGIGLWRRVVLRPSEAPAGGDLFDALAQELTKPNGLPELLGAGVTARELAFMLRQNPLGIELLLKQALSQAAENVRANESTRLADEIRHCRETGRSHDVERLENLRAELRPPPARLAVVIDQMEELFTLEGVTPDLRRRFVQVLAALARSGWAWVIGTLRSDFFARCAELPDLMQLKAHGLYDLQPPTADELGQMIRRPAAAAGLRFERNAATDTELDQTLRDVAARSPEALPLLEFALDQLYERRTQPGGRLTWAAYEEIGGLEGALACAAEEALAAVEPWRQETFDHVMGGLVTLGTDLKKGAHRRTADYETLTRPPGARTMVDRFIETRLFVADKDTAGHAIVSVAHEALLARKTGFDPGAAPDPAETTPRPPAGDASERVWLWTRLGEWIDANADFLRMRAQVAAGLKQWQDAGGDTGFLLPPGRRLADGETILRERPQALSAEEQSYIARSLAAETGRRTRQARVRALVSTGLALLALGAGIGAWFGFRGRRVAQRQTLEAEKQRVTATQNERLAREKEGRMRASASLSDFFQADDLAKAQQLDDSMAFLARALRRDPSNYAAARRVLFVAQQYSWYLPQANDFPAGVRLIDRVPQPGGGARLLGEQRGEVRLYDELGRAVSPSFGSEVMNVPKDGVESLLPSLRLCDGGRAIATPGLDQNKGPRYWSASTGKPIAEPFSVTKERRERTGIIERAKQALAARHIPWPEYAQWGCGRSKEFVAVVNEDTLYIVDFRNQNRSTDKAIEPFHGGYETAEGIVFSPNERMIMCYGGNHNDTGRSRLSGSLSFMDLWGGRQWSVAGLSSPVIGGKFSPDGATFLAILKDGSSFLFSCEEGGTNADGEGDRLAICSDYVQPFLRESDTFDDPDQNSAGLMEFSPDSRRFVFGATRWAQVGWRPVVRDRARDTASDPTSYQAAEAFSNSLPGMESVFAEKPQEGLAQLRQRTFHKFFDDLCGLAKEKGKGGLQARYKGEFYETAAFGGFAAKSPYFAAIDEAGECTVWDIDTGNPVTHAAYPAGTKIRDFRESTLWLEFPTSKKQFVDLKTLQPLGEMVPIDNEWHTVLSWSGRRVLTDDGYVLHMLDARSGAAIGNPTPVPYRNNTMLFSADDSCFYILSTVPKESFGTFRVWDTETMRPLSKAVNYNEEENNCLFAADGAIFLTTGERLDVPPASAPAPDWLPALAETLAGRKVAETGSLQTIPASERAAMLREIRQRAAAGSSTDPWSLIINWWLDESESRKIAPRSPVSVKEYEKMKSANDGGG